MCLVLCFCFSIELLNSTSSSSDPQRPKAEVQSPFLLHRLLRLISWRGFSPSGQFSLALLFDVGFLSGFNGRRYRASLARRDVTRLRNHFPGLAGCCVVEIGSAFARRFVILFGSFARSVVILAGLLFGGIVNFGRFHA